MAFALSQHMTVLSSVVLRTFNHHCAVWLQYHSLITKALYHKIEVKEVQRSCTSWVYVVLPCEHPTPITHTHALKVFIRIWFCHVCFLSPDCGRCCWKSLQLPLQSTGPPAVLSQCQEVFCGMLGDDKRCPQCWKQNSLGTRPLQWQEPITKIWLYLCYQVI